jgi:peptide/nickel transport system substrate-binding protein
LLIASQAGSGFLRVFPRVAVICAALTAFAGCTTGTGSTPGGSGGAPRSGGELTYAVGTDLLCVDPQQAGNGDELAAARGLADSLTDQDPGTGRILPWLAASWQVSADARSYTFHLRSGVTFSDGTPLDAPLVKADFDGLRTLGARAVQAMTYLSGYRGTTVVDPLTVRIDFTKPNAAFLHATSTVSLALVGRASLAASAGDRCTKGVVGSGPFTLRSFRRNQQAVESGRKDYAWGPGAAGQAAAGRARLDTLVFAQVPEQSVRVGGLQSGQFGAIDQVAPQNEQTLKSAGFTLSSRPNPGLVYSLNVNASRPATRDVAVRRALQKAIDRRQIVDTVLAPEDRPATSILGSTTPGYTDLSASLTTDTAAAGRLLDSAGWVPGPDGVRSKDGRKLTLVAAWYGAAGPVQSAMEIVQQQLKKIGVAVTLKPIPIAEALATFKAGDYDLIVGDAATADPDILRNYYTDEGLNAVRLPAGPLRTALDAQASDADQKQRDQQVAAAQRLLVDDAYAIPLYESGSLIGISPKVHGITFDSASRPRFSGAWVS